MHVGKLEIVRLTTHQVGGEGAGERPSGRSIPIIVSEQDRSRRDRSKMQRGPAERELGTLELGVLSPSSNRPDSSNRSELPQRRERVSRDDFRWRSKRKVGCKDAVHQSSRTTTASYASRLRPRFTVELCVTADRLPKLRASRERRPPTSEA